MAKTVLVVDDDADIRGVISEILEIEGYQVFQAENGQEGLETLERHGPIGCIILDNRMPVMNGPDFLEALPERHHSSAIFFWSANEMPENLAMPVCFLRKPVDLEALLVSLKQHCRCKP